MKKALIFGVPGPDGSYLAGQRSVGLSLSQPVETIESVVLGTVQILEVMRYLKRPIRFCNAVASESHSLQEFVETVFRHLGLDWRQCVTVNRALYRPSDLKYSRGTPAKAEQNLGWQARTRFAQLIPRLIQAEQAGAAL